MIKFLVGHLMIPMAEGAGFFLALAIWMEIGYRWALWRDPKEAKKAFEREVWRNS